MHYSNTECTTVQRSRVTPLLAEAMAFRNFNNGAGFCKQQLWPMLHYWLPLSPSSASRFSPDLWQAYVKANKVRVHSDCPAGLKSRISRPCVLPGWLMYNHAHAMAGLHLWTSAEANADIALEEPC